MALASHFCDYSNGGMSGLVEKGFWSPSIICNELLLTDDGQSPEAFFFNYVLLWWSVMRGKWSVNLIVSHRRIAKKTYVGHCLLSEMCLIYVTFQELAVLPFQVIVIY